MSIDKNNISCDPDNPLKKSDNIKNSSLASQWDDKELFIRKVFETDQKKGCEILFRQYYNSLCSYTVRFVYSKEVAQDIVGDIFYNFWKNETYNKISTSFRAYLFISVRNSALKYLRKEFGKGARNALNEADTNYVSSLPTPQEILQFQELSIKIERAINSLSPQNQKIFLMSRIEGKKYSTISEELMLSQKTIEAHVSKALGILRKVLRNELLLLILVFLVEKN